MVAGSPSSASNCVIRSSVMSTPTTAFRLRPGPSTRLERVIPGRPMLAPPCNDSYITLIASAVGDVSAGAIGGLLEQYPGSNYLRTDQTCPSLTQDKDGEPIYVVYFGPFVTASDACAARAQASEGSYVRRLSETLPPTHSVSCDD